MKKIVATVSFSPDSMNAARYAADMAAASGAELNLFHVLHIPVSMAEIPITEGVYDEIEENGRKSLLELREELEKRTAGKIKISMDMIIGSISYRIRELCDEDKPFLVVMGISGNPMDHIVTGNTPLHEIQSLSYPLLIVPEKAEFHPLRKILVACDADDLAGGLPVAFMNSWKEAFGSEFELLNISTTRQEREISGIFEADSWKERMREIYPALHIVQVDNNDVEEGVGRYLESCDADMVMVFPKRHSFLEFHKSRTKRIASQSTLPVLALHA